MRKWGAVYGFLTEEQADQGVHPTKATTSAVFSLYSENA